MQAAVPGRPGASPGDRAAPGTNSQGTDGTEVALSRRPRLSDRLTNSHGTDGVEAADFGESPSIPREVDSDSDSSSSNATYNEDALSRRDPEDATPVRMRRDSFRVARSGGLLEPDARDDPPPEPQTLRQKVRKVMHSWVMDGVVATVILLNLLLICLDTDARANFPGHEGAHADPLVARGLDACFAFYFAELLLHIWIDRSRFLHSNWNVFDSVIIAFGILEYGMKIQALHLEGVTAIRIVHLLRLLRLIQVLRLFSVLKELRRLMNMFASCFKTIGWAFCLLMLVMTIWSCIAVDFINPIIQEIAPDVDAWADHPRAIRSYATIWWANITFFTTIVAQDNWGLLAVPIIEARPWTFVIFAGALMTLMFGILNLIVAVIVDTCADNRAKDFIGKAHDMAFEEREEKKVLGRMFQQIDEDKSGAVSWDELKDASLRVEDFRHWLRAMDVDSQDLQQLFTIVDEDGSGTIDPDEFIEAMYRLKNTESKTTTKLIKHIVTKLDKDMKNELDVVKCGMQDSSEQVTAIKRMVAESEVAFRAQLREQEQHFVTKVEVAITRAVAVALETAMQAAAMTLDMHQIADDRKANDLMRLPRSRWGQSDHAIVTELAHQPLPQPLSPGPVSPGRASPLSARFAPTPLDIEKPYSGFSASTTSTTATALTAAGVCVVDDQLPPEPDSPFSGAASSRRRSRSVKKTTSVAMLMPGFEPRISGISRRGDPSTQMDTKLNMYFTNGNVE